MSARVAQKKVLAHLELERQTVVGHLVSVLAKELNSGPRQEQPEILTTGEAHLASPLKNLPISLLVYFFMYVGILSAPWKPEGVSDPLKTL